MQNDRLSITFQRLAAELESFGDALLRAEFGLTHSQFQFMLTLLNIEEADVTTLAKELSVSKAAVSKRVTWFVHRGLVAISHESKGSRRLILSLTPKGQKLLRSATIRIDVEFKEFAESFNGIDVEKLHEDAAELLLKILEKEKGK